MRRLPERQNRQSGDWRSQERQRQRINAEAQRTQRAQRKAKDLTERAQLKGGEHGESGIDPRPWRGRLEANAPASLRKITQGKRDDDAYRIVRKPESTARSGCATWEIGALKRGNGNGLPQRTL